MKKYNQGNFFKHTFCQWQQIELDFIKDKQPSYKSKTGSMYYFDQHGVARYSNHWGRAANCRWSLTMNHANKVSQGYYLGYAKWDDFHPNNEQDCLYVIQVDLQSKTVGFTHKDTLPTCEALCRTAGQTKKRIVKIKEVLQNDQWHKYMDYVDLEQARSFIVEQLVNTNDEFLKIKQRVMKNLT